MPGSNGLSFDDALTKYIGEFGRSQQKLFFAASLIWISNGLFILLMVFANKDPIKAKWFACTNPEDAACAAVLAMTDPTSSFCDLNRDQWQWTDPNKSIISSFELTCGRSFLAQIVNSAFFLGYLIGSGLFGNMADQQGRRKTLLAALVTGTVFTLMSAFSPNYWVYFVSRLLTGIGAAGQSLVTYLIATESIGPAWRGSAGVGTQLFFVLGEFLLVPLAYLLQPWRMMCISIVVIGAASCLLYPLIPESPRWLLAKGRTAEAVAIMERMAAVNGTRMPLEPLAEAMPVVAGGAAHMTLGSVLKDRHIRRRFIVLAYAWCVLCMTYYGISIALNGLAGSIYILFLVAAAAEIPSNILAAYLIERIGRHNSLALGMLLGGVACLICSFCPAGILQAMFAGLGKFGCAGAFTIASIYTSELFPTLVRSAVLGAENEAARLGGIAAPFIVLVGTQLNSPSMPFLIFGATSVLAGLLIFTLPETLGAPMPDTLEDMDAIQSIFSTGAWKKGWKTTRGELFSTRAHGSTKNLQQLALSAISEESQAKMSFTGNSSSKEPGSSAVALSADSTAVGTSAGASSASVPVPGEEHTALLVAHR